VVEDQKTGLLVPIGDVEKIAQAVGKLLGDAQQRRELGSRAHETANERFSLKRMVDEIEKIYLATG
jgi:glycosyltransferase involved in cell wall biosynthesis